MKSTRLINLVQDAQWAIVPEKLEAIHQFLWNRAHGIRVDLEQYAANAEKALQSRAGDGEKRTFYTRMDEGGRGVAIITMEGVLSKRMNLLMYYSGGTSTELLARDLRLALAAPEVKAIVLDISSPGGTVDGTEALANLVYSAREEGGKPVVAFGNGLMASAAYWIGSAARRVILEETAEAGSIGVVQVHYDYSAADAQRGVKRTLIYAGKYKRVGNDTEPLSREDREYLQSGVDYTYSLFVDAVARNRDVGAETVLSDMAEGRLFIGRQAVEAGLADETGNLETAIRAALSMAEGARSGANFSAGRITPGKEGSSMPQEKGVKTETLEATPMTAEQLVAEYPDQVARIQEEAARRGAESERDRTLGLAAVMFGEEEGARLRALCESGVTVEQFQAVRDAAGIGAEAESGAAGKDDIKKEMLEAIQEAGAEDVGAGASAAEGPRDFMEAYRAIKEEGNLTAEQAMKKAVRLYPELHKEFLKRQEVAGSA